MTFRRTAAVPEESGSFSFVEGSDFATMKEEIDAMGGDPFFMAAQEETADMGKENNDEEEQKKKTAVAPTCTDNELDIKIDCSITVRNNGVTEKTIAHLESPDSNDTIMKSLLETLSGQTLVPGQSVTLNMTRRGGSTANDSKTTDAAKESLVSKKKSPLASVSIEEGLEALGGDSSFLASDKNSNSNLVDVAELEAMGGDPAFLTSDDNVEENEAMTGGDSVILKPKANSLDAEEVEAMGGDPAFLTPETDVSRDAGEIEAMGGDPSFL